MNNASALSATLRDARLMAAAVEEVEAVGAATGNPVVATRNEAGAMGVASVLMASSAAKVVCSVT